MLQRVVAIGSARRAAVKVYADIARWEAAAPCGHPRDCWNAANFEEGGSVLGDAGSDGWSEPAPFINDIVEVGDIGVTKRLDLDEFLAPSGEGRKRHLRSRTAAGGNQKPGCNLQFVTPVVSKLGHLSS
jgi:hypothetical protein